MESKEARDFIERVNGPSLDLKYIRTDLALLAEALERIKALEKALEKLESRGVFNVDIGAVFTDKPLE
jgi:hypothetical protein